MPAYAKTARVKVKIENGITRPDIEIEDGFDYNYPDLNLGDVEVDVTITCCDDPDLTDKVKTMLDLVGVIDRIKLKPSFVLEKPKPAKVIVKYKNLLKNKIVEV